MRDTPAKQRNIGKELKRARHRVIQRAVQADRANNVVEKIRWEERRRSIDQLIEAFNERESADQTAQRRVFVSYSKKGGILYFNLLKNALEFEGFDVITGFDPTQRDVRTGRTDVTVLGRILSTLNKSTLYCGILTKELEVISDRGVKQWAPSVWTIEEKGMALALGKPAVFLIEDEIHSDFWKKTTPEKLHYIFNGETFNSQLQEAVAALKDRYDFLALRSLSEGRPFSELGDVAAP